MLDVLSSNTKNLFECKLLFIFRNFNLLTRSHKSFSNGTISLILRGQFNDFKPQISCSIPILAPVLVYKLDTDEYVTTEAVTSTYKKVPDKINNKINKEGKRIMKNKTSLNRMFINGKNNRFITLKDHK